MIRKLDKAEFQQATTLALEVYLQCGQDDFEDEGLESPVLFCCPTILFWQ